jgi:hypothetical protein
MSLVYAILQPSGLFSDVRVHMVEYSENALRQWLLERRKGSGDRLI